MKRRIVTSVRIRSSPRCSYEFGHEDPGLETKPWVQAVAMTSRRGNVPARVPPRVHRVADGTARPPYYRPGTLLGGLFCSHWWLPRRWGPREAFKSSRPGAAFVPTPRLGYACGADGAGSVGVILVPPPGVSTP